QNQGDLLKDTPIDRLEVLRNLHFNLSFADALLHIPKFALMFKSVLNNKEKLFDLATTLKKLSLPELTPTRLILELEDRSTARPVSIVEDVFVKVGYNTIANPRSNLKVITTRSGVSYDGQPIPPLFSSSLKVVKRVPEVTKDTVQTSTKNIQPLVVQTQVPIDEPVVTPKPKLTIPYPSRINK
nr:hypothetical protein [Tanacetum cinerariifolium]